MQWVEYDDTVVITSLAADESIEIPLSTPIKLITSNPDAYAAFDGFRKNHANEWQKVDAAVESQVTRDDRSL